MKLFLAFLFSVAAFAQVPAVNSGTATYPTSGNIPSSTTAVALANGTTATTQAATDNSTNLATTAYDTTAIANAVTAAAGRDLVAAATAATLPNTPTFLHVDSGIGSTFTSSTNSVLVVDGYTPLLLDRILVKNQATAAQNGIYSVTQLGVAAVTPWIITRTLDYDQAADMNNTIVPVKNNGTVNALTSWIMTSTVATVDTDAVNFASFTPAGANIVTAASPGAGIAHFAGATQTVTSSAVVNADIANTTIDLTAKVTGLLPSANIVAALSTQTSINGLGITASTGTLTVPNGVTMTGPASTGTVAALNQTNTFTAAGVVDLSAASVTAGLKIPAAAGAAPTADDFLAFNTTNHTHVWGSNGTTMVGAIAATGTNTATTCSNQAVTVVSSLAVPTCSTLTNSFMNTTVMGIGAATTGAVTISSSATDTKVVELPLPAGYLNTSNKTFRIEARGIYTTTGITPTLTHKVKLCTVSGCGSGTVLVLYSAPATGATTSGASNTWIVQGALGTISTGATGTVMLHADACTVLGASGATACTPTIDANTAASSTIDLTAALFLDWMVNASAVTTLTETPNVAYIHPTD